MTPVPWFISYIVGACSLLSSFIVGKKIWWGWAINIFNLFVLAYINLHFHLYGLVVVNIIMLYVFQKNAREWYRRSLIDRLRRTIRFGVSEWGWNFGNDWYDGPYFYIRLGWFFWVINFDGLPYIFQDKEQHYAEGDKASLPKEGSSSS